MLLFSAHTLPGGQLFGNLFPSYTSRCYSTTFSCPWQPDLRLFSCQVNKLDTLNAHTIQKFYNSLGDEKGLTPKTIKNIYGVLHKALSQAVMIGYLRFNPADACTLPRIIRKDISLDGA
jgi:hypothetical protein